jgi:hypothetical protein
VGDRITYVGLDVHKDGIVVAVAEGRLRGEVRDYGGIANTPAALQRLVQALPSTDIPRIPVACKARIVPSGFLGNGQSRSAGTGVVETAT